jgi:hypothetical protein
MLGQFMVADVSDPRHLRLVTDRNILGGNLNPRLPSAEKFVPELWKDPNYVNSCGGRLSHFIHTDTAITALGDRLYIRSTGHLYCIGPTTGERAGGSAGSVTGKQEGQPMDPPER